MRLARICVFCGASTGHDPRHAAQARAVGSGLAERGVGVVYGGGRVGLMGELADGVLAAGGEIIGVIPRGMVQRELAHPGLSGLRIVESLHQRKAVMAELADAFIVLPGGLGTLEELAEALSWAQLGLHAKPIGLLDANGYWRDLVAWMDGAVASGFVPARHRDLLAIETDLAALLGRFDAWDAPPAR